MAGSINVGTSFAAEASAPPDAAEPPLHSLRPLPEHAELKLLAGPDTSGDSGTAWGGVSSPQLGLSILWTRGDVRAPDGR
jgi:hypothetical protein